MPNQITTTPAAALALSAQIQRLKMKALTAAATAPYTAADYSDSDDSDSESALGPPPSLSHPRLKRRLRFGDDLCECGSDFREDYIGEEGDEFTGPDGSFKLPRLMHPELKRQHAVASIKHERRESVSVPARTSMMLLSKPSRALPCAMSRTMNLRFVQ